MERDWQETDFLQHAFEKVVMVWTKEMLEPTISALYNAPTTQRLRVTRRRRLTVDHFGH